MKRLTQKILAFFSRRILAKYKPKIIGITGSVGKTSAKEAIFLAVSQTFPARKSERNYNNEFGVPFTVIGVDSPERNPSQWVAAVWKALSLILITQRYADILVLEMGIDRPGDMAYLLSIVHPDIAVITNIGISHYEFFHDVESIEQEKGKIAEVLQGQDILIVNADNEAALRQKNKTHVKTFAYSTKNQADIMLTDIQESLQAQVSTSLTVKTSTRQFAIIINAVGEVHLSAVASAAAVGEAMHIGTAALKAGLGLYKPSPGRLNILAGIKDSTIIDDTYNASPDSMKQALALLDRMPAESKMAVLGDMLELGDQTEPTHVDIGQRVAAMKLEHLVTVGPNGKVIASAALSSGMPGDKVLSFDTSDEAKKTVQELLKPNSAVLVKGSQGVRMEKVTKKIMAEPELSSELLCRQYGGWAGN